MADYDSGDLLPNMTYILLDIDTLNHSETVKVQPDKEVLVKKASVLNLIEEENESDFEWIKTLQ